MNIAKGLITKDYKLAEEIYMRWLKEYGSNVEMWKREGRYEVIVNPYILRTKGEGDFIVRND